jgi:type II secretory pathway component GspD/PulD (secretin)
MTRSATGVGVILALLLAGGFFLAHAEDPAAKTRRTVFVVQHGLAKDLAETLTKHFKSEKDVQIVAEPASNTLLLTAPESTSDELLSLIRQLDRRPQLVSVEVAVLELANRKAEGKADDADKEVEEKDLSGPSEAVQAKIQALKKAGQLATFKEIQLSALENQRMSAGVHENKPFVAGTMRTAVGGASNMINYRNVGSILTVTPQVAPDGVVTLDLRLEDARLSIPADGVVIGTDDKNVPIRASEFVTATLEGKVSVPTGQTVFAKGVKTTSKSEQGRTIVLVSARVEGTPSKPAK